MSLLTVTDPFFAIFLPQQHHATIATNPVTSLAIARSPELRRATTVARMATFLASVMLPIPAEAAVVEVAADRTAVDVVAM